MTRSTRKGRKAGLIRADALEEQMARKLDPASDRICYEQYGPDGEIVMATGDRPHRTDGRISYYIVTCHGYAPPKTDWRERGVVPLTEEQWGEEQERKRLAEGDRWRQAAENRARGLVDPESPVLPGEVGEDWPD